MIFVLAESMPKTWAILHTERAGLVTSRFTEVLVRFWPLRIVSRGLIGLTNVLLPGKGLKEGPFVSEQELLGIVEAAADDDVIEHEERELIESIIEFGDTVAREVMVPRPDMITVPDDATITAALDVAIAHGYSRLPLQGARTATTSSGCVYTKDLIRAEREGRGDTPASDLARPVRFIPENKPVARLMREMQAGKFHLAIVADEYGGIAGLITLEDCLEELVGEIVDEYDIEELAIQPLPNGDYLVEGGVQVEDLNEVLDVASCPTRSGTPSAGCCSARSSTCPSPVSPSSSAAGGSPPRSSTAGASSWCACPRRAGRGASRPPSRPPTTPAADPSTQAGELRSPAMDVSLAGQGRARHRRVEGHRQGDRRGVRRRRAPRSC